jgi:hypothetical protein
MKFFPAPEDIEEQCVSISEAAAAGKALARIKADEDAWKESGEERVNVADLMKEVLAKKGKLEAEKPKAVVLSSPYPDYCPCCSTLLPSTANVVLMTPAQMRAHANVIEEIQRQAKANRQTHMEQLASLPDTPVPSVGDFDEVQL